MNWYLQNRHIFSLLTLSLIWMAVLALVCVRYVTPVWKYNGVYTRDKSRCIIGDINSSSREVNFSSAGLKWQHYDSKSGFPSNVSRRLVVLDEQKEALFMYEKLLQTEQTLTRQNIDAFREEINKELGSNISSLLYLTKTNSPVGKQLVYYVTTNKKFNVSSLIYEKLPEDSIPDRINRCSVVGNSGALLNSSCGKHIDDSDFVYRCNAAPLEPFAEDAGIKSNLTSFNPTIFSNRYHHISTIANYRKFLADMRQYNGVLWGACLSYDIFTKVCLKAMNGYNITSNTFVLGHPDHFRSISGFWKRRGYKSRPSTGFYYVTDALTRCNEIHLYGFWPFPLKFKDGSFRNASYHYFDDVQFRASSAHSMNAEFSLLVQLHTLGIVKLHVGKCRQADDPTRGQ